MSLPLRARSSAVLVAAAVIAAGLPAIGAVQSPAADPSSGALRPLRISSSPLSHLSAIYLGEQQGFFTDHGIELVWDTSNPDSTTIPALLAGQVDITTQDLTSLIAATSNGLDIKAIVPASASTGGHGDGEDYGALVALADGPVQRPSDLEGRIVSSNLLTNIAAAAAREAIRADGGDFTKVQLLELPFPDAPAALVAGQTQGAWLVEPFLTIAKSQGAKEIGWGFWDLAPGVTVSAYVTTGDFAAANPELVADFRAAVRESFAYARAHEDEVRAILPTFTTLSPELAQRIVITGWQDEVTVDVLDKLAEYALADGIISAKPDLTQIVLP